MGAARREGLKTRTNLEIGMANWRLEKRMKTLGELSVPQFLLVGDNDVAVRMAFVRGWFLAYHGPDLDARLRVYRHPPEGGPDDDMVLGPECRVWLDPGHLSRPLTTQDYEPLATNLKEVLRAHLLFPGAVPPKIERVCFINPELRRFDD